MGCSSSKAKSNYQDQKRINKPKEAKIILIGKPGVGKKSLYKRIIFDEFDTDRKTYEGMSYNEKPVELVDGNKIILQVWNPGTEEEKLILPWHYYSNTQIALFVYDLTDSNSLNHIKDRIRQMNNSEENSRNITKILIGNKIDIPQRVVKQSEIEIFIEENGISYNFEVSAASGDNIDEMIKEIAKISYSKLSTQ